MEEMNNKLYRKYIKIYKYIQMEIKNKFITRLTYTKQQYNTKIYSQKYKEYI